MCGWARNTFNFIVQRPNSALCISALATIKHFEAALRFFFNKSKMAHIISNNSSLQNTWVLGEAE